MKGGTAWFSTKLQVGEAWKTSDVLIFRLVERHMHTNFTTVSLTEVEMDLSQSTLAQSEELS